MKTTAYLPQYDTFRLPIRSQTTAQRITVSIAFLAGCAAANGARCASRNTCRIAAVADSIRESAKKLQRFLTLGVFNLNKLWVSVLQVFLKEQFRPSAQVYVAIDRTTWRDINLLVASIVWKGRAIPLYWQRLETIGNSHYETQTAFLSDALTLLGDYRVGVLGDREFCSVDLARWLGEQGHGFYLRQKKSTYVLIESKPWLKLGQLGLTPGTKCFYQVDQNLVPSARKRLRA